jgi:hypothetical protein
MRDEEKGAERDAVGDERGSGRDALILKADHPGPTHSLALCLTEASVLSHPSSRPISLLVFKDTGHIGLDDEQDMMENEMVDVDGLDPPRHAGAGPSRLQADAHQPGLTNGIVDEGELDDGDDGISMEQLEKDLPTLAFDMVPLGELLSRVAQGMYTELGELAETCVAYLLV